MIGATRLTRVFEAEMAKTKEEYMADFKKWGLLGGRPRAFKSPKDMAAKIAEWLANSEARIRKIVTKKGDVVEISSPEPILVESFCVFCGITKTTFYEYAAKAEYKPLTDWVRQNSEKYLAEYCVEGPAGNKADFILKNAFGDNWKEKSFSEFDLAKDLKQAMVGFVSVGDVMPEDCGEGDAESQG